MKRHLNLKETKKKKKNSYNFVINNEINSQILTDSNKKILNTSSDP